MLARIMRRSTILRSNRGKLAAALLVSVAILGGIVTTQTLTADRVSAETLTRRAQQEKDNVLDRIMAGEVLHITNSFYNRANPALMPGAFVYPEEDIAGEIWMGADAQGNLTTYVTSARSANGELLAFTKAQNGRSPATWVPTGEKMDLGSCCSSLVKWVGALWDIPSRELSASLPRVGNAELNGRKTVVFERRYTPEPALSPEQKAALGIAEDADQSRTGLTDRISRLEVVEDAPLIWRSNVWEVDAAGERNLLEERTVLGYDFVISAPDFDLTP